MTAGDQLKQLAIEIANNIQERALNAKKELTDIEIRKAQIEAQLESANLCRKRLSDFAPEASGDFQCPRCWVVNETRSPLKPIPGTDHEDIFRCRICHLEFSIPF